MTTYAQVNDPRLAKLVIRAEDDNDGDGEPAVPPSTPTSAPDSPNPWF